jgi:hypothetical protein
MIIMKLQLDESTNTAQKKKLVFFTSFLIFPV